MSKNRPRLRGKTRAAPDQPGDSPSSPSSQGRTWARRVFRNSYTYRGRLVRVKRWSVKIQYQGRRQTFALHSNRRAEAGREAATIYQRLRAQGWTSFAPASTKARASAQSAQGAETAVHLPMSDLQYWEPRLLRRPHPVPAAANMAPPWSVRIEHKGISSFLSLGTSDARQAAARAAAIHRDIVLNGWAVAGEHLVREVTLGIHWSFNPVAWTYTTFHTKPAESADEPGLFNPRRTPGLRVGVLEADAGIRRALQHWIEAAPEPRSAMTHASLAEIFQNLSARKVDLWLVNKAQTGMSGNDCLEKMKGLAPNLCVLPYSVYEDSNQLFLATPGGASAYLLKRTPPNRLLDPILGRPHHTTPSLQEIQERVKLYFQGTLKPNAVAGADPRLAHLTSREYEVLGMVGQGAADKEIAARLGISIWTIRDHLKHIFAKLGVHTRTEAVVKTLHK